MKVFVTGATGYIGTIVAERLSAHGHHVLGLARSAATIALLEERGIEPLHGNLHHAESIARGTKLADGVIHLAVENRGPAGIQADATAIEAILAALDGTGKPFIYTSGISLYGDTGEHVADEDTPLNPLPYTTWRAEHEHRVLGASRRGIRSIAIRP